MCKIHRNILKKKNEGVAKDSGLSYYIYYSHNEDQYLQRGYSNTYQIFPRRVSSIPNIFQTVLARWCIFRRGLSTFPKGSWDKISKGNVKQFSKIPKGYTNGPQQRMIQGHTLGGMDSDTPNTWELSGKVGSKLSGLVMKQLKQKDETEFLNLARCLIQLLGCKWKFISFLNTPN